MTLQQTISTSTEDQMANAIRALAMDAVQAANSGHPGAPMGMADIAEVLWNDFHAHNPANPAWPNRDRFVLSNGHGSMLQYAALHLTGYELSLDDIDLLIIAGASAFALRIDFERRRRGNANTYVVAPEESARCPQAQAAPCALRTSASQRTRAPRSAAMPCSIRLRLSAGAAPSR